MSKSVTPLADEQVRKVLEFGAKKHGTLEAGGEIYWRRYWDHADDHGTDYLIEKSLDNPNMVDEETNQHILAHMIADLKILLEHELRQEKE